MKFLLMSLVVLMAACNDSTGSSAEEASSESSSSSTSSSSVETGKSSSVPNSVSSSSEEVSSSSEESGSSSSQGVSSSSEAVSSSVETSSSSIDAEPSFCANIMLSNNAICDSRDGQVYTTTVIGTQTWMAENLNFETNSGSYCYADGECVDGRFYTWEAAMDGANSSDLNPSGVQGICPQGWHLPSKVEWETLFEYVAEETGLTDDSDLGATLKATSGWDDIPGDDLFGFSAVPARWINSSNMDDNASWWSATENTETQGFDPITFETIRLAYHSWLGDYGAPKVNYEVLTQAMSIRCVKD